MSFGKLVFASVALLMASGMSATTAKAAVIFNETYDAIRLQNEASINGDRADTLIGSSLHFGASASSTSSANFLDIAIFGAGVLSDSSQYTVTISVEEDRALGTFDQDPSFGLSDGTSFLGLLHADNEGGRVHSVGSPVTSGSPDTISLAGNFFLHITGTVFDSSTMVFEVGPTDSVSMSAPHALGPFSPISLDAGLGLTFRAFGDGGGEQYAFKSISILVEDDLPESGVPAPGALALLGLGLMGVAAARRKAN